MHGLFFSGAVLCTACQLACLTWCWLAVMLVAMETQKVTVRLDAELAKRLRLLAVRDDKTVQEIVSGLLEAYVVRKEAEQHG